MKITNSIVWDHRGRVAAGGLGQVEIRITIDRKSYYISTGIKVHKTELVAGQVVNCPGAKQLNERIAIIYSKVLAYVNTCVENNVNINIEDIRHEVWRLVDIQSDCPTFIEWVDKQIPMLNLSKGTAKHYLPLVSRLIDFGKIKKWNDVTVENICEWDVYLHTITKPISDARRQAGVKPEHLGDGAIYNYHKNLKTLLNRAVLFDLLQQNPYDKLHGRFSRGTKESVEYLTDEEMQKFETIILPTRSPLDVAHDLFVFQAYTGLSFSDAQAFDINDYKWDGMRWVNNGERIKTGVPYVSVILPPALHVLEKYGMKVPKMNNADYNRQLKALQVMTGIKTRLHSHLARHTFATWMLKNGVKIENVARMLGHTNITQTQRYAKVLAESVHEDFDMVAEKMFNKSNQKSKIK